MKEVSSNNSNQQEVIGINPNSNATRNADIPTVLRDNRGRVLWKLPENTTEENEQLGILNVQGLLLEAYPDLLELFPFGEDGMIPEDKREEAQQLILQKIGSRNKFTALFGLSTVNRKTVPYFRGSYLETINIVLRSWGLNFNMEEIKRLNKVNGLERKIHSPEVDFFSQRDGLVQLFNFLTGKVDFSQLKPFVLELSGRKPDHGYSFYVGSLSEINDDGKRTNLYLGIGLDPKLQEALPDIIYAIPNNVSMENKEYYWIDFYTDGPDEINSDPLPFTSCRLKPEDPHNKINFVYWHNIGEQLLSDYLDQDSSISFEDLVPFNIKVKRQNSLNGYKLTGRQKYTIYLKGNPKIQVGDQLQFTPRQYKEESYKWLEVLRIPNNFDEKPEIVSRIRLLTETGKLVVRWMGLEQQLFIDYLSERDKLSFEDLLPIRAKVPAKGESITLATIDGRQIVFYLPPKTFSTDEEVIFIPKQDELYQWIDLHRTDSQTHAPLDETIASARIIDGDIKQRTWLGSDKQRLKDYSEGKIGFDKLKPILFELGDGKNLVYLWKQGNKKYLTLPKKLNLIKGDNFILSPEQEAGSEATFLLEKEGRVLERYKLNLATGKFTIIEKLAANKSLSEQISPDQANEELMRFLEVRD